MSSIQIRTNTGLSSREIKILQIFRKYDGAISAEILRRESDLDHGRIHRTLKKLLNKKIIKNSTRRELKFYRPDRSKFEEAIEDLKDEGIISEDSEVME